MYKDGEGVQYIPGTTIPFTREVLVLLIKLSYSICFLMKIEVIVEMSWMKLIKDFHTFCKYPAMFFCSRPPHGRKKEHPKVNIKTDFLKTHTPYFF